MPSKKATTKSPKKSMSTAHKAALASGREHGRIVRDYLDALEANKPKRGRKRTPQSITNRIDALNEELEVSTGVGRLLLIQELADLQTELSTLEAKVDVAAFEEAFVEVAAEYSQRKGISYSSWRAVGVEAAILKRAGISRAS